MTQRLTFLGTSSTLHFQLCTRIIINDICDAEKAQPAIDEIKKLASIPSMDELRAKIIGLLQAPAAQLARVTKAYSEKEAA